MACDQLIVLFGHENTDNGELSQVAVSRCDAAIRAFSEHPDAAILPTGAYGAHFNKTDRPHSDYVRDYLTQHGIPANRILCGTDSSGTFEDCLCARKTILDNSCPKVIAITSDYHVPRLMFILSRIFQGIQFVIHSAETPQHLVAVEGCKEQRSFKLLKKNWISPALYERGGAFPSEAYDAAANDQRHYDNVSLASVTGAIVVGGVLFRVDPTTLPAFQTIGNFWAGALVELLLLLIYERCSATARTARRSMRFIEIGFGTRGFSANYNPEQLFEWLPPIKSAVRLLFFVIAGVLFVFGMLAMTVPK